MAVHSHPHPDVARARAEAQLREVAEDGSGLQPQIAPYSEAPPDPDPALDPDPDSDPPDLPLDEEEGEEGEEGEEEAGPPASLKPRPAILASEPEPRAPTAKPPKLAKPSKPSRSAKPSSAASARRASDFPPSATITPISPPPPIQRHSPGPPFDWANAPLSECSARLKWLQDEAASGITSLAQRSPREEMFRCWCCSEHARDHGRRPPCYDPTHEKIGPDQKIVRPVSTQTVRVRDFPGAPERLVNLNFASALCLAYYQKKVYGMRELPIMAGR